MTKVRKRPTFIRSAFSSNKHINNKSHEKLYTIIAKDLNDPNTILGLNLHVGYTNWSKNRTYVSDCNNISYYMRKGYRKWLKTDTNYSVFIVRVNSKTCPININLKEHLGDRHFSFTMKQSINTG